VVLVGHVTKEARSRGPRVVEHIVDAVLYFEGDTHQSFPPYPAFQEIVSERSMNSGVFAMTDKGLRGVSNPSAIFLSPASGEVPGSCILRRAGGHAPLCRDPGAGGTRRTRPIRGG